MFNSSYAILATAINRFLEGNLSQDKLAMLFLQRTPTMTEDDVENLFNYIIEFLSSTSSKEERAKIYNTAELFLDIYFDEDVENRF
jgi:hypothetical protein